MRITGTGIDIVNIRRFDLSAAQRLGRRVLTPYELEYCTGKSNFILHMSGRIAAKEALFKALSQTQGSLTWKDIEILSGGVPTLSPGCKAFEFLEKKGLSCSISISHEKDYAIAQAIVWGAE